MSSQSSLPPLVPAIVFSLLIGGIGGYILRGLNDQARPASTSTAPPAAMTPGGGGPPGMMGGMMGMGGGQQPAPGTALARLVRNLSTLEKVQDRGVSVEQARSLLPILKAIQSADKLPEAEAKAKLDAIEKTLSEPQKQALQDLQPRFGGGMGGMMGRGAPGAGTSPSSGGAPGGPGSGMMGGMMGGQQDPERPFASERNKQALTDLIAALEKVGK
jgi:hypothetical protein